MSRFPSLTVEGGLISPDLIDKIADGEGPGQKLADFGLPPKAHFLDEVADAWASARRFWEGYRSRIENLPSEDMGTSITRDQWVIPLLSLLGYELTYQAKAQVVDELTFAVSHRADSGEDAPPVHVVGWRQELGKLPPSGRPRLAPHVLVQEYLNRTEHLWGVVTNGRTLRLLRDCQLLSRQAYIEFDLESMLEGERLADFALLWRLVHRTRLPLGMDDAPDCLLEQLYATTVEQGGRVRERLRDGVENALNTFGNGILSHPDNQALHEIIRDGGLAPETFYQHLLRLVYRLLFLMVAEERKLLSPSLLYNEHYSLERLRSLADLYLRDEGHKDLWLSLQAAFDLYRREDIGILLQVPPLNGELFAENELDRCSLTNKSLLSALRELSTYAEDTHSPRRRVNYAALDVEELGSVYESLLEYHPTFSEKDGEVVFRLVWGMERKTTGSYYTPPELVSELIKSALEPVLDERTTEQDILALKICDPACGSGHFLLAAARRIGKQLARVRTGDEEPAPEDVREAMRDVISHCIYGVDKNPLAVDLCKVALWIEGHTEGKPLSFLDHRIRCGDSLVGVRDLKVLEEGIPDGAFDPVTGDDRKLASSIKKENKLERSGAMHLALEAADKEALYEVSHLLDEIPDDTPDQVREKARIYEAQRAPGTSWFKEKSACNLWCTTFFTELTNESYKEHRIPTTDTLRSWLAGEAIDEHYAIYAEELAERSGFFHWPLEFPEVFEVGGFDAVLCNPPWELIQLQEEEFFANRDPEIANAPNASDRKKRIKELKETNSLLWDDYRGALHVADATRKFLRSSEQFPLTSSGRVNCYSVFSERFLHLLNEHGRAGVVVPTGIATIDTNKAFFAHIVEEGRLESLYDFENREAIFAGVHRNFKFCLLTLLGKNPASTKDVQFAFFLTRTTQLRDPYRTFKLSPWDLAVLNPNTRTCPTIRTFQDAELIKDIHKRIPILVNEVTCENPWGVSFKQGLFNMSSDSNIFRTREQMEQAGFSLDGNRFVKEGETWLPLYEAKMIWQFDHRFGTYEGVTSRSSTHIPTPENEQYVDPAYFVLPWYWVSEEETNTKLGGYKREWLFGFRDITNATNERTAIFTLIPKVAVGNSLPIILLRDIESLEVLNLAIMMDSLLLDYIARLKISWVHMNFFYVEQLPVVIDEHPTRALSKAVELVYTSWDIKPFVDDVWREADEELRDSIQYQWEENKKATGGNPWRPPEWAEIADDGMPLPPFKWDEERRAHIRAELDAIYARLYGLNRKQLRYILDPADLTENELENILDDFEEVDNPLDEDAYLARCESSDFPGETFRVLKNKEMSQYGYYHTRRLVLQAWQEFSERE